MAYEKQNSTDTPSALAFEVEFGLGDILDTYRDYQDTFFAACRNYALVCSSESHDGLEEAALNLELRLVQTIHTIAGRQSDIINRARLVHGFVVADDAMRTALFNELVPEVSFVAYSESEGSKGFNAAITQRVQITDEAMFIGSLAESAVGFLHQDVAFFGEAVAMPKLYNE